MTIRTTSPESSYTVRSMTFPLTAVITASEAKHRCKCTWPLHRQRPALYTGHAHQHRECRPNQWKASPFSFRQPTLDLSAIIVTHSFKGRIAAAGYGTDKAIFGYGYTTTQVSITNLVSNTGVVATDTTGVGTARYGLAATGYGSSGQAIFGYGIASTNVSMTNLVSNTGVVATDTTGVGTARNALAAASYGS